MALTRKMLEGWGIESDKIDLIIEAHSATVKGLKEQAETDAEKAEKKLADVQKELDDLNKEGWKEKYEKEHSDFESYKNGVTEKETKATKEKAVREWLKSTVNIADNRLDAVMRVTNLDDYELDESGKVKDSDTKAESAKKEWADFVVVKKKDGANPPQPKNNEPDDPPKMSRAAQLTKQYQKNLYGEAKEN